MIKMLFILVASCSFAGWPSDTTLMYDGPDTVDCLRKWQSIYNSMISQWETVDFERGVSPDLPITEDRVIYLIDSVLNAREIVRHSGEVYCSPAGFAPHTIDSTLRLQPYPPIRNIQDTWIDSVRKARVQ